MDFPLVILSMAANEEEAKKISEVLVDERLAACVNRIPNVQSIYLWKKKRCDDQECLMIIKSKRMLLEKVILKIKELHSYEVPEIIAVPIMGGSEDYLNWLEANTR